jgi:hypothetical protein
MCMKSVSWPKPGYASITCSTISNIPYNLTFNDSSILITINSCDYLNLSLADEHVGDVTISTQVIEYNQNFLQADQPIRLKYSNQIKLYNSRLHNIHKNRRCEFKPRSGEGYSIQHYVIKFVSDLRQVDGFLRVIRFPPPIKLTATI